MLRLMNRDAQFAVAAARLALQDARLIVGTDYAPEDIGLFGATGMAGLPLGEVAPLLRASTGADGRLDLTRFGQAGLRAISPLLSFKILGNMPLCFVSICENIQGPNAIYTPWEGQGAQAIEAGCLAIQNGQARCALVGGCDAKTHELAFLSLEQQGVFQSWKEERTGAVPGEGAVFLVLEKEADAAARGARSYVRVADFSIGTRHKEQSRSDTYAEVLRRIGSTLSLHVLCVSSANGAPSAEQDETQALSSLGISATTVIHPKKQTGDLFAAAAPLQVALGALLAERTGGSVLANCFGHGSEQATFVLEKP